MHWQQSDPSLQRTRTCRFVALALFFARSRHAARCVQQRRRRRTRYDGGYPAPAPSTVETTGADRRPRRPRPHPTRFRRCRRSYAGEPFPADRCEANKAAGTITYLSSFDFAASASIVDVLVAKQKGYFDDLCLDVERQAELLDRQLSADRRQRGPVLVGRFVQRGRRLRRAQRRRVRRPCRRGRTGIDALIVKEGQSTELSDLKGKTIGVKGAITPSVAAMLKKAGLTEGTDYKTVAARRLRPEGAHRDPRDRRVPRLQEQRAAATRRPPASRSSCTTPPTTASPAASACSTPTRPSSTSTPPPRRTSCAPR